MRKLKVEIKSFEAECPRCGESDDRSIGLNVFPLRQRTPRLAQPDHMRA